MHVVLDESIIILYKSTSAHNVSLPYMEVSSVQSLHEPVVQYIVHQKPASFQVLQCKGYDVASYVINRKDTEHSFMQVCSNMHELPYIHECSNHMRIEQGRSPRTTHECIIPYSTVWLGVR